MKRAIKKINKGEPLPETLDVFLATYRSTPSGTTQQKSPSEMLFGRQMRTTLDLLRPTETSRTIDLDQVQQPRQFNAGDLVYAKVHKRNEWYWEAGKVIEKVGAVNYNIWLEGQRVGLIRSHINQLRSRHTVEDDNGRKSVAADSALLPLTVLLDEFHIQPRPTVDVPEIQPPVEPNQPIAHPGSEPAAAELNQQQGRESTHRELPGSRIPVATTSRGRPIRLPPRFEHYIMT